MISQRFGKHLKQQDWFSVFTDLLVVIIGIFIGLQVTQWHQSLNDRKLEKKFVERLIEETSHNIERLNHAEQFHIRVAENITAVSTELIKQPVDQSKIDFLRQDGLPWFAFPTIDLKMYAWNELINTGRIDLIRDSELRDLLQGVASTNESSRERVLQLGNTVLDYDDLLEPILTISISEEEGISTRMRPTGSYDIEKYVKSYLLNAYRHKTVAEIRMKQAKISQQLLDKLKVQVIRD